ncbi:hypothetical protein LH67_00840 [Xenorhabdus nematophila]|nr:hypothetical protein LH67_00840 [Xenorhabdus nematophila]
MFTFLFYDASPAQGRQKKSPSIEGLFKCSVKQWEKQYTHAASRQVFVRLMFYGFHSVIFHVFSQQIVAHYTHDSIHRKVCRKKFLYPLSAKLNN